MTQPIRFFSPSETARRLGVSIKALRVYEAEGLVSPVRTEAGWRAYGPEQMVRLHQILALKRLGLPLKRIGELLGGQLAGLDSVLALQEEALRLRKREADQGLRLLARARGLIARGETLSTDDLTQLTRETTVTDNRLDPAEWRRVFGPLTAKHFTEAEQARLAERNQQAGPDSQDAWAELIGEANAMLAAGADPASAEAMDVARRWMGLAHQFTGADPAIGMKLYGMWKEALQDDQFRSKSPVSPELLAFMGDAIRAAYGAGLVTFP